MYRTILDHLSPYHPQLPSTDDSVGLIAAGEIFVAYEETLPPDQQSPLLPDIRQLLQQCIPSQQAFQASEAQRTIASETVKRLDEQAKTFIRKLHHKLHLELFDTPEAAEQWGFQVKQSTRTILLPQKLPKRLVLLNAYIAKEESRPPEERFTAPDLAEVTRLRDELKTNLAIRRSSRSRRKASYSARAVALKKLYECLRVAGSLIIIKHFDHTITTEMAKWGFEVVKRSAKKKTVGAAPAANGSEGGEER